MVYKKFADKPNPQDLNPVIPSDYEGPYDCRSDDVICPPPKPILTFNASDGPEITVSQDEFIKNIGFIVEGALTADLVIIVPPVFKSFAITNKATGSFDVYMQLSNDAYEKIHLDQNAETLIGNDTQNLIKIRTTKE